MLFKKPTNMNYLIVEGNIGAGKSTFLRLLNEQLDVHVVYEPHEQWQDVEGHNLLDKFYSDTSRWAYTFQTYAFITRILEAERQAHTTDKQNLILERSVYSDRYCFAKNAYEMGTMSSLEWTLYKQWFSWLVDTYTVKPDGFIYLQTTPDTCFERMKKRNRSEEATVSHDYLTAIHQKHEQWLIGKDGVADYLKDIPVLVLPCDIDFENNQLEQEKHMQAICSHFNITPNTSNSVSQTDEYPHNPCI